MFSHVTLGTNDLARAIGFYDAVLGVIGHQRFHTFDMGAGYGVEEGDQFWVVVPLDGNPANSGNGTTIALIAPDRDAVRTAYRAALENSGSDDGAPGLRDYHDNYYGAYVRDPDGNKLCVVCHDPDAG